MKKLITLIALFTLTILFAQSSFASENLVYFNDVENPSTVEEIQAHLTANDDLDGDLTDTITIVTDNYTGNETIIGQFDITFSVTDSNGQTTNQIVVVDNRDILPPTVEFADFDSNSNIIRVPLNATIAEIQADFLPQNFHIIDSFEGTLTESAIVYDSLIDDPTAIDLTVKGDYPQIIRVSDSSGNTAELEYTLRVQDLTVPVITGPAEIIKKDEYILSSNFFLSYFEATDNLDGDLTSSISVESNEYLGNADEVGTYQVVLSVQDTDGNKVYHTLTIKVKSTMFAYLIIDQYKWIVPNDTVLTDEQFVQELKRISDLPDDNFVFTSVSDTYTANADANGSYEKVFTLASGSGSNYSRDITLSVVDPNINVIEDDPTFFENASDIATGAWVLFKKIWWILGLTFLVGFGIYQNKK